MVKLFKILLMIASLMSCYGLGLLVCGFFGVELVAVHNGSLVYGSYSLFLAYSGIGLFVSVLVVFVCVAHGYLVLVADNIVGKIMKSIRKVWRN